MKIAYYMPFKPMGHPNPSGDLVIGTELYEYFQREHHTISPISDFRCRWLYHKPYLWPRLIQEYFRVKKICQISSPDLWLTYHSYYKAPDMLGPYCCNALNIPYAIFQGIYSTKRKKRVKTFPGFHLNTYALQNAQMVFTNKRQDEKNLKRLLPEEKINFVPPGIQLHEFQFSHQARRKLRLQWQAQGKTVVMSAAMFRPGVKTRGLLEVINACYHIQQSGKEILLVIAGDGSNAEMLKRVGTEKLGTSVLFLGKIDRLKLYKYYSAADLFAFPGIDESLGMVYLEAQSCRLPVVAFKDWGAGTAVQHKQTGLLSSASNLAQFTKNIDTLITNKELRQHMAITAQNHIIQNHDLEKNYSQMSHTLRSLVKK
jgi:glycosyltransferase involved in cell wall biosynthesis